MTVEERIFRTGHLSVLKILYIYYHRNFSRRAEAKILYPDSKVAVLLLFSTGIFRRRLTCPSRYCRENMCRNTLSAFLWLYLLPPPRRCVMPCPENIYQQSRHAIPALQISARRGNFEVL